MKVDVRGETATVSEGAATRRRVSGRTRRYSISLPDDLVEAVRELGGNAGVSAYVIAAVRRQVEHDRLAEFVAAAEAEIGPITEAEIQAKLDRLARAERGTNLGADRCFDDETDSA
jgi:hypothetical protein